MKTLLSIGLIIIAGIGVWFLVDQNRAVPQVAGYKNATYVIEGQSVTLTDGYAETAVAPGSASKTVTRYFGNLATGDLNNDGMPDVAFLLTQDAGGSGTFYYSVVALKTSDGYQGTNAILLGDRIAPQTTEIREGQLIVNYADRRSDEPMTTQPSIGVSKYLKVEGTTLTIDKSNLIRLTSPLPNAEISSPVTITGEARGNWYFEASFPVFLTDWDGKIIGQGIAEAQSGWMTADFVPFKATLSFDTALISGQYSRSGTLILKKDNPSGLPEHDDALEIPVRLK
ncbi:MAG: Gmad2 immunoglobulin-like domain-containing protein [Candidatus Paceibacterota bacterium]|jgi:hypothetical protein